MIHIGRNGSKLGAFSEFEVRQGLASGRFFPTDLGWKEGMENWAPLSQFEELAPAPPVPAEPEEQPELNPEPPLPPGHDGTEEAREGLPWDYRHELGLVSAFIQTARDVLFTPATAFARMRESGPLSPALLFNLLGGWFGLMASCAYAVILARMQAAEPVEASATVFRLTPAAAMDLLRIFAATGPILVTIIAAIGAFIVHMFLMLAGGANKGFHVTLRVFCFIYGSTQLMQIIPGFGGLIAQGWLILACGVGLASAHGTSRIRSFIATGLFIALCLGGSVLLLGAVLQSAATRAAP